MEYLISFQSAECGSWAVNNFSVFKYFYFHLIIIIYEQPKINFSYDVARVQKRIAQK